VKDSTVLMVGILTFGVAGALVGSGIQKKVDQERTVHPWTPRVASSLTGNASSKVTNNPAWMTEPRPSPRTGSQEYWQAWCRATYGTPMDGPGTRQRALDWSDHCTEAGDANGR
jgi:hypothetical protein